MGELKMIIKKLRDLNFELRPKNKIAGIGFQNNSVEFGGYIIIKESQWMGMWEDSLCPYNLSAQKLFLKCQRDLHN